MNRRPGRRWIELAFALALLLPSAPHAADNAPAATTPDPAALAMLQLARVGPRDNVIALGSGDARAVIAAATRLGAKATIVAHDPLTADLSTATVVVLQLPAEASMRLRSFLLILQPGTRIVSRGDDMGDWRPDRTVAIDAPDDKGKPAGNGRAHLWVVPANLTGEWCGQDSAAGMVLRLDQRFQQASGAVSKGKTARRFEGRIDGARVVSSAAAGGRLSLAQSGDIVRVSLAEGEFASLRGASFAKNCCGKCP